MSQDFVPHGPPKRSAWEEKARTLRERLELDLLPRFLGLVLFFTSGNKEISRLVVGLLGEACDAAALAGLALRQARLRFCEKPSVAKGVFARA